jgi:hypothetical protein
MEIKMTQFVKDYDAIIKRHKDFWNFSGNRPLTIYIDGWVDGPRLLAAAGNVDEANLKASDFEAERFLSLHRDICLQAEAIEDDKITMTEPLVAIPWLEVYHGCGISLEGKFIWPKHAFEEIEESDALIAAGPKTEWMDCYLTYMRDLSTVFLDKWAISQPILRGIADIACALMGTQNFIFGMMDDEEKSKTLVGYIAKNSENFYKQHMKNMPMFRGGYVVGQYFLWTPEMCLRIQDDAIAVLSPDLYERFILSYTEQLSKLTNYTLMHLHLTSGHMLDKLCAIKTIRAIEYDIDEGCESLLEHMDTFKKIQGYGKNLVIKARFKKDEIQAMKGLDSSGLCLIPVVDSQEEINEINAMLKLF